MLVKGATGVIYASCTIWILYFDSYNFLSQKLINDNWWRAISNCWLTGDMAIHFQLMFRYTCTSKLVEKRLNFSAFAVDLIFSTNAINILFLLQHCHNIFCAVFQLSTPSDSSDSHPFWIQMTVIVLILAILMRITVFVFSEGWKATCDLGKLLSRWLNARLQ